jgi:hypothetical protein
MKYEVVLLENDSTIRKNILEALKPLIDQSLTKAVTSLRQPLVDLIKSALRSEPEYASLISGQLRWELGIADVGNVDIAINNIANSIEINKQSVGINNLGLSGGMELKIINNQDFGGALSDQSAFVNDAERGYSLPWLEWLLLKGNAILVRNFEVKFGPSPRSRSGNAIMIGSSSNWRVPPEFAGTIRDNWTTRAIDRIDNQIIKLMQNTFESSI